MERTRWKSIEKKRYSLFRIEIFERKHRYLQITIRRIYARYRAKIRNKVEKIIFQKPYGFRATTKTGTINLFTGKKTKRIILVYGQFASQSISLSQFFCVHDPSPNIQPKYYSLLITHYS